MDLRARIDRLEEAVTKLAEFQLAYNELTDTMVEHILALEAQAGQRAGITPPDTLRDALENLKKRQT